MARLKTLTAALLALPLATGIALAAEPSADCQALQKQLDDGATLSKDAQDAYDECFPITPGDDVTNIVPGLLPIVAGAGGVAALSALGSTGSTGSTN